MTRQLHTRTRQLHTRTAGLELTAGLHLRAADEVVVRHQLRTIDVLAVPYDSPQALYDAYDGQITETIAAGAFVDGVDLARVRAFRDHDLTRLIGRAAAVDVDDPTHLRASVLVARTPLGDETLELAADGALDVSIGFSTVPGTDLWDRARSAVTRTRCRLAELSLVPFAAYAGTAVVGVRHDQTPPAPTPGTTPNLTAFLTDRRNADLDARYDALDSTYGRPRP